MNEFDYSKYIKMVLDNRIEDAIEFRREKIPQYIYKFYPDNDKRKITSLRNGKIWCSKIGQFNDPFESTGYYFEEPYLQTEKNATNLLLITCFAEDAASNISMWAYYANCHKGFCVKFEVLDKEFLYDVNYIKDRISQNLWLSKAQKKLMNNENADREMMLIYEKYLTKHYSWSNEKEYRKIMASNEAVDKGREYSFDELKIKPVKIYAGINCNKGMKKELNSISKKLGCGDILDCCVSDKEFLIIKE